MNINPAMLLIDFDVIVILLILDVLDELDKCKENQLRDQ